MPLQNTYRPTSFDEFIGNESSVDSLLSALNREDFPRVFLCTGKAGCGKTSIAFILKEDFEVKDIDFYYYNSANTRGIDTIRQITNDSKLSPMDSNFKMYVMDEIHAQTSQSLEAILLLLENPPEKTIFVLCTSEPEKLKLAIKRRCFQCNLQPASNKEVKELLQTILSKEQVTISNTIEKAVIDACQGSLGMAVAILDAVIDMTDENKILNVIAAMKGVTNTEGIEICRGLMKRNWNELSELLSNFTGESESLRHMILSYFSKVLLSKNKKQHAQALNVIINFSESTFYSRFPGLVAMCCLSCKHHE